MGKYCCFLCPSKDYSEKTLDTPCPTCRRPYGFPLSDRPESIREYRVVGSRGRGFYASTYLCERGRLKTRYILKVSPVLLYGHFNKNFEAECESHRKVAQDTEHIVSIEDYFDESIRFGDVAIPCHVAVLGFVEGELLRDYLQKADGVSAEKTAQVAIDLFRIWRELTNKNVHHNDLHADNIILQHLSPDARRAEAIDGTVRAVAIDLGSVADRSISDSKQLRLGDQHWLCRHIQDLVELTRRARRNIDGIGDLDIRLSDALEKIAYLLIPSANAVRLPSPDQMIRIVKDEFTRVRSPWQEQLKLELFSDSYNALALEPWFVPFLLVDPDGQWVKRISKSGPMLIIGMRGCGKTMLLRALEFHARAARSDTEPPKEILARLQEDRFVGLFVSCTRLLTIPGGGTVQAPFERLFCAYCIEAIRAVRHLQELDRNAVYPIYHEVLAETAALCMDTPFDLSQIRSDHELERLLLALRASLSKGENGTALKSSPADAFGSLAEAIRKCSPLWNSSRVFFLLDDLSTRFLREPTIDRLFSSLIFQNPTCAFKLSTEAQTLEMALHSPGLVEKARVGRDYEVFDLGAEVYEKTKERRKRGTKLFIEDVLEQRARYYPSHPKLAPSDILGDCNLEEIARRIASSTASSRERKGVYHGVFALSAVCVGDIGDVISIYELILRRGAGKPYPVSREIQSQCYQDFCSRRLYDLNRRESDLKDFALGFAEASHELLFKSHAEQKGSRTRLRQYSSVYVRVTTGDTRTQFERLRELIDAGVFVLHGGTPRTKTRDSDPIQQFKLTYRRLFGLSNFIGLAERDRFELSGEQLEEWLAHPEHGKEILLRNLGGPCNGQEHDGQADLADNGLEVASGLDLEKKEGSGQQLLPLDTSAAVLHDVFNEGKVARPSAGESARMRLQVRELGLPDLNDQRIDTIIIGLGFEERTLESAKRLLAELTPRRAILIRYSELGRSQEILDEVSRKVGSAEITDYGDVISKGLSLSNAPVLVDVTGLAKPALFNSIRKALQEHGSVWVAHTGAEEYYPLDGDISGALAAARTHDHYRLLECLSPILTGEAGPYTIDGLLNSDADESRRRVLCTFASAKHQRLLSLLDYRDYDRIEIVEPFAGTPRSDIARIAAEIAAWNFRSAGTCEIRSDDLEGVLTFLSQQYFNWYVDRGYNFEIGLTGSKLQAVACAAVSVEFKVAQCWYVRPANFDPRRFTKGVAKSRYFGISRSVALSPPLIP
jgi:serine/threonine protein kinase